MKVQQVIKVGDGESGVQTCNMQLHRGCGMQLISDYSSLCDENFLNILLLD